MKTIPGTKIELEQDDRQVQTFIDLNVRKAKTYLPNFQLPSYCKNGAPFDWLLISIDVKKHDEPIEGDLYLFQHFGKEGDSGLCAWVIRDVFQNRAQLDVLQEIFTSNARMAGTLKQDGGFWGQGAEVIKGLKMGHTLYELYKKGILNTPPPHPN
jgi:hypothetical protein